MTVAEVVYQWLEKLKQADIERNEVKKRDAPKLRKPKLVQPEPEFKKAIPEKIVIPAAKTKKEFAREEQDKVYLQNKRAGYVYLMRAANGYYKIGISKNVKSRKWELNRQFPISIEVVHQIVCNDYRKVEKYLHDKYSAKRVEYEWFNLDAQDVQWITSLRDHSLDGV